ncbi:nucleoporin protein Ndc1-Nup [Xylariaceae sp. FL0016]|nr:nucleoporin protein Ndc1-Nup [Xylariaceae sp. FL0016]
MPPTVARRAPYKDFLQPALQRRFAANAAFLLAISYLESLTLSTWDSLIWSWFPVGLPGVRALAIFASILFVVILRIKYSHVGIRTSDSPSETIIRNLFPFSTLESIVTFAFSAWLYSQAYLYSMPENAGLAWITRHSGDRPRLNEKALFYTTNMIILGLVQGVLHISLDHDRMLLGMVKPKREGAAETASPESRLTQLGKWAPVLISRAGMLSIAVGVVNYIFLYSLLRRSIYHWTIWLFRWGYPNLPRSNLPPSSAPWNGFMLVRSIWAGFLLSLLWSFGDMAFRLQLGAPPLKKNIPLTDESKDPNGSLLNGLKSKKSRISSFAMWELALIARDFPARRQAIFEDIDRMDGPMWSNIYMICLTTIKTIEQRIDEYGKPPALEPNVTADPAPPQPRQRIVQPPKMDNVWASAPAPKPSPLAKLTRSPGRAPADRLVPAVKKRAAEVADQLMTQHQRDALKPEALNGFIGTLAARILEIPCIGQIFQHTFRRRLAKVVLGTPHGEPSVYVNAAYALSQFAVRSLSEDKYGNVQRDVPAVIRTFTIVIKKLEKFQSELPTHWTDVDKKRECPEVTALVDAFKDGLGELVTEFGPYSSDLRLTRADMRLAREAAATNDREEVQVQEGVRQAEMQQVS